MLRQIQLFFILSLLAGVQNYPQPTKNTFNGAICKSMTPNHGPQPQTSPSPYKLDIVKDTYKPNEEIEVSLSATAGNFKGFMIQARRVGEDEAIGTFNEVNGASMTQCNGRAQTHSTNQARSSLLFKWTAPAQPQGDIQFIATFVKSKNVFWVGVVSTTLKGDPIVEPPTVETPVTTENANSNTDTKIQQNAECGKSLGCFSDCDSDSCGYQVTFREDGDDGIYTLTSMVENSGNAWMAIGFSEDSLMGDDNIMGCVVSEDGSDGQMFNGQNRVQTSPTFYSDNEVSMPEFSRNNGILRCTFRRKKTADSGKGRVSVVDPWTLLFARGQGGSYQNNVSIEYHNFYAVSSSKLRLTDSTALGEQDITTLPSPTAKITKIEECGNSLGCFSKCSGSSSCDFLVTFVKEGDSGVYTLATSVNSGLAWMAVGLSSDSLMGDDDVFGCLISDDEETAKVFTGNNGKRSAPSMYTDDSVTIEEFSRINDVISCKIKRPIKGDEDLKRFDISKPWTLLFARGNGGSVNSPAISQHRANGRFASRESVRIEDKIDIGASKEKNTLIKVHGALMVAAWVFFASVGIVIARYYKPVWKNNLCSQKVWFQVHRLCMIIVFLNTCAGFIVIFIEVKEWSTIKEDKKYLEGHPVMGVIVTALTILNPLMALCRPHPNTANRPIFNWAHWFVGTSAHVLGVVTIFFGIQLTKADAPDYLVYIMAGYVAWQLFVELLLEFLQCRDRQQQDKPEIYEVRDSNTDLVISEKQDSKKLITTKRVILFVHLFVVSAISAVVIAIIGVGESKLK